MIAKLFSIGDKVVVYNHAKRYKCVVELILHRDIGTLPKGTLLVSLQGPNNEPFFASPHQCVKESEGYYDN